MLPQYLNQITRPLLFLLGASLSGMADPDLRQSQRHRSDAVLVRGVVSGDTVAIDGVGRVRLLGIVAPRVGRGPEVGAPLAREAREKLAGIVTNRWVRLEYETDGRAPFNRRRAYLLLETGTLVNAVMVREGLARLALAGMPAGRVSEPGTGDRGPGTTINSPRLAELMSAEAEARGAKRGIWGHPAFSRAGSADGSRGRGRRPTTGSPGEGGPDNRREAHR